jgi:hypothetical protein
MKSVSGIDGRLNVDVEVGMDVGGGYCMGLDMEVGGGYCMGLGVEGG